MDIDLVGYILYNANFRLNNWPDMSLILAYFAGQFGIFT